MGEIAEMAIDGFVCEQCGQFFDDGDAPGHPRTCNECAFEDGKDGEGDCA